MTVWDGYLLPNADTCKIHKRTCCLNFLYECVLLQEGQVIREFVVSDQYLPPQEIAFFHQWLLSREKAGIMKLVLTTDEMDGNVRDAIEGAV